MKHRHELGVLAHILGIFTGFVGPLILYLVSSEGRTKNRENMRNVLNFQLSLLIYVIVSALLIVIFVGILLLAALSIFALVTGIVGAVRASEGTVYKYPLTINFIK